MVTRYTLDQNYPNPFNPSTKISYSVPARSFVNLKVYDALGSQVVELVNEIKESGSYSVDFNGSGLTSGVYFCRITASDLSSNLGEKNKTYVETRKMVLMK